MVRNMLSAKKIPKRFWPEAVNWTVHVLNRSPTFAVKNKTPEEAWSGIKPSVHHFRVFSCIAHAHVPDCKRSKLDDKSVKCVLLGINKESKAYHLYDPISWKIIVSRDVVFDENNSWDWSESPVAADTIALEWENNDQHEEHFATDDREGNANNDLAAEHRANSGHSDQHANPEVRFDQHADPEVSSTGHNNSSNTRSSTFSASPTIQASSSGNRRSRPEREHKRPLWMRDYISGEDLSKEDSYMVMFAAANDPVLFYEAVKDAKWRMAMDAEIDAIERNDTWELTCLPTDAKKVGVKWAYKTKFNENGEIDKYKARLVAKGYTQEHGIDYTKVFAPVARMDTVRLVISLAAQK